MDIISFTDTIDPISDPKLKRAQSLVGTSAGRPEHDWYPTPSYATEALLMVEPFVGSILEPACGDGAISKVLLQNGHTVLSTDLIDRGYGEGGLDFISDAYPYRSDNIITNPPFTLAEPFVRHALTRSVGKVAMLAKVQFLEGVKRRRLFESTPLKRVWIFSKRLSLTRQGKKMKNSGMLCFCWFVWDHAHRGPSTIGWL
jgi:hypothetical protein